MKTVAFYQPFMNERGTCTAMFDYAYYNQTLLGNKSIFIYDSLDVRNESKGLQRISSNFEIYDIKCANYDTDNVQLRNSKLDDVIEKTKTTHIYMCKSGYNDGVIPTKCKVLIHNMGMVDPSHKHGDVWAYVSYFSSRACSGGKEPAVPFMVFLPEEKENLRKSLNIPENAIVFGRYGGQDTFNPWVYPLIQRIVNSTENVYFLFMNTPKFLNHSKVIFLESTVNPSEKAKFINTCDAMLHVRHEGETFGMACAEFSFMGKPVITDNRSPERNHIEILGDKGIYFDSPQSLYSILTNFRINKDIDWNCYKDYSPEKIIKIFNEVYLK